MRKIFLTVNTDTADLRYVSSPADAITNPADAPQIYSGEEVIFCCTFIGEDLQPVSFAETDTFDFGIDTNFDHADNLMAYTDQINLAGDWSEADVTAGKISFRITTATTATAEKLAALADLQVKLEIRQFVSGSTLPSVLCQAPAVMHNTVIGVEPSAPDAEAYLTAAQVTAITDALTENVTAAQSTADDAATAAEAAQTAAAAAQTTADAAQSTATAAQSTATAAQTAASAAQTTADGKLTAPAAAGTAGQVLTLDSDAATPVWANPSGGGGRNLFDIFYSMSSQTPQGAMDLSLGTLISSADTAFPDFYNECVSRADAGTIPTCTEAVWQSEVSTYGSCAKFVVNTTDKSIRLPKITNYLTSGTLGSQIEEGLPNILGTFSTDEFEYGSYLKETASQNGAFRWTIVAKKHLSATSLTTQQLDTLYFDASLSNAIYGNSNHVTPKTSQVKLYIQVYSSAVEASMAQAAELIAMIESIQSSFNSISDALSGQFSETTTSAGTTGTGANDTVVEYWRSADTTMWYRLWATGWVEQGGFIDRTVSADTTVTISLPVEFSDSNYTILRGFGSTNAGEATWRAISTTERTTTTFDIYVGNATNSANTTWFACGWSA